MSIKSVPDLVRDPMAIAIVSSLVIHGLVGVTFSTPLDPVPDTQRKVQLVQLTPEEQSRLPQFSTPRIPLPAGIPAYPKVPGQFPGITSNSGLPSLGNSGLPSVGNSGQSIPYNSQPYFPWTRNSGAPEPVPNTQLPSQVNIPTQATLPQFSQKNSTVKIPGLDQLSLNPQTPSSPGLNLSLPQTSVTPSPSTTPAPNPGQRVPLPKAAVAYQDQKRREFLERFTFSDANRTSAKFSENTSGFLEAAKDLAKNGTLAKEIKTLPEITDFYPEEACRAKLKSDAQVGVIVGPDGKLVGKPQIVWSSGYPVLDEAALSHTAELTFEAGKEYRPMWVPYKFEYSDEQCSGKPPGNG